MSFKILQKQKIEMNALPSFDSFEAKTFHLKQLKGVSKKTISIHFKLYAGYVKETNRLSQIVTEFRQNPEAILTEMPSYAHLLQRLSLEYNGMILHEAYFENLQNSDRAKTQPGPIFMKRVVADFGNYKAWQENFISAGQSHGAGWALCCANSRTGRLSNHWIFLHDLGSLAGFEPILVMDVWEHAYFLDYLPSEREKYIQDFFANVDWAVIEKRLKKSV